MLEQVKRAQDQERRRKAVEQNLENYRKVVAAKQEQKAKRT